jgi:predicted metalloprotease with PDZ domain
VVDARLRRETNGRRNLDDVMSELYRRHESDGYAEGAFETVVKEMGGEALGPWLSELLRGTTDPDFDAALDWFGLDLDRHPDLSASEADGEPAPSGLGVTWEKEVEGLVIASVVHGGGGADAGLLPGDELLAISGERITHDILADRLLRLRIGETVNLLLSRRGRIIEAPLKLSVARSERYQIETREDLKSRYVRRLESWLGQELEMVD